MYCPQCLAEYQSGVTICGDCNVPLVKELDRWDEEDDEVLALAGEHRAMARTFLRYGLIALAAMIGAAVLASRSSGDLTAIPVVLGLVAMYICFGISAFRYAQSKGYSGAIGLVCMLFGIIGLVILLNLRDKLRR